MHETSKVRHPGGRRRNGPKPGDEHERPFRSPLGCSRSVSFRATTKGRLIPGPGLRGAAVTSPTSTVTALGRAARKPRGAT